MFSVPQIFCPYAVRVGSLAYGGKWVRCVKLLPEKIASNFM